MYLHTMSCVLTYDIVCTYLHIGPELQGLHRAFVEHGMAVKWQVFSGIRQKEGKTTHTLRGEA
jgi:hypothetical protein